MIIRGSIEKEVTINGEQVKYHVAAGENSYGIVSEDKQAVKDLIFLRKGQNIEVDVVKENEEYVSRGALIELSSIIKKG